MSLNFDVVPPLSDDVQLTVDQYRSKLYEVSCTRLDWFSVVLDIHLVINPAGHLEYSSPASHP